jgi:tRNA(Phe) wybutosine-synthesizing methylase Tyw3
MAFELPRRAFEHARTLTDDETMRFLIDAIVHTLAETEEAIEALKLRVDEVERRMPK